MFLVFATLLMLVVPQTNSGLLKKSESATQDQTGSICNKSTLEILFLLDGSVSVGPGFGNMKEWVKNSAKILNVGDERVSAGVVQYSHYYPRLDISNQPFIVTEIEIGQYSTYEAFANAVDGVQLHGFTTYTGMALKKAALDFQSTQNYGKDLNKQMLILITEGLPSDPLNIPENAKNLRDMGVETWAIGVGNAPIRELRMIATGDNSSDERVLTVDNFSSIDNLRIGIQSRNCADLPDSEETASTEHK